MNFTQKRYIYSGIFSGIFFTVMYGLIDIDIILSLIITVFVFLAGILIFKEKDVRKYDPAKIMDYYYQTSKLLNYSNFIDNKRIKDLTISISKTSENILNIIEKRQKRITDSYNFYDYYMNLTLKIVNKYINVKSVDSKYVSKVDDYLYNINQAFEKQLNSVNQDKTVDVDKEIRLFEKVCKINDEDIEGSEDDV